MNRQLFDLDEPKEWVRKKRLVFGILPATNEAASSMSPMVVAEFNSGLLKNPFLFNRKHYYYITRKCPLRGHILAPPEGLHAL